MEGESQPEGFSSRRHRPDQPASIITEQSMVTKCLLNDVSARAEAARAGGWVGGFVSWTAAAVTVLAGVPGESPTGP